MGRRVSVDWLIQAAVIDVGLRSGAMKWGIISSVMYDESDPLRLIKVVLEVGFE